MHKINKDVALEIERNFVEKLFESFLYIIGPTRSGTRIFSSAINVNKRFFSCRMKMRKFEYWGKTDNIDYIIKNMFRIPLELLYEKVESDYVEDLKARISVAYKDRNYREILACKAAVHFIIDSETADPSKHTHWTMKSNDFYGLSLFKDALSKSKYVFIIRNPHSTIMSQTTRMGKHKGLKKNQRLCLDVIRASRYWCHFSKAIINFRKKYPDNSILIRYEDFIESPETVINQVFTFADNNKINNDELKLKFEQLKYEATNHPEIYTGISKKPLNRWSVEMKRHEITLVSLITRSFAKQFGYHFNGNEYELTTPML